MGRTGGRDGRTEGRREGRRDGAPECPSEWVGAGVRERATAGLVLFTATTSDCKHRSAANKIGTGAI